MNEARSTWRRKLANDLVIFAVPAKLVRVTCILVAMMEPGCDPNLDLTATTDPPALACPVPAISTDGWQTIEIKAWAVRFKLPRIYSRDPGQEPADSSFRAFRTRRFDSVSIEIDSGRLIIPQRVFDFGQPDYGYSECRETIGGREAILQSFRGGGSIFYRGRSFITYRSAAVYEISPGRVLRIQADTADRRSQEEILVAFRTVQFTN